MVDALFFYLHHMDMTDLPYGLCAWRAIWTVIVILDGDL